VTVPVAMVTTRLGEFWLELKSKQSPVEGAGNISATIRYQLLLATSIIIDNIKFANIYLAVSSDHRPSSSAAVTINAAKWPVRHGQQPKQETTPCQNERPRQ